MPSSASPKSRSACCRAPAARSGSPASIGKSKAMEMCLTGRMMDAAEAERPGLVARVVPLAHLMDEAVKLAERIAGMSAPIAAMMVKESVNRAYETTLAEGVRFERRLFHAAFATADQEGRHDGLRREAAAGFQEQLRNGRNRANGPLPGLTPLRPAAITRALTATPDIARSPKMAHHKSAKKRIRQTVRRTEVNRARVEQSSHLHQEGGDGDRQRRQDGGGGGTARGTAGDPARRTEKCSASQHGGAQVVSPCRAREGAQQINFSAGAVSRSAKI